MMKLRWLLSIAILALLVFTIKIYQIEGISMEGFAKDESHLAGVRILFNIPALYGLAFGDKVVVDYDNGQGYHPLIKYIAGLPGDTCFIVRCFDFKLFRIRGKDHHTDFFQNQESEDYFQGRNEEKLNCQTDVIVLDGSYYVMGKNAYNSTDSRAFGPISFSSLKAKILCRLD
jgi:signal peptidase I